jgi:hypothetical protein
MDLNVTGVVLAPYTIHSYYSFYVICKCNVVADPEILEKRGGAPRNGILGFIPYRVTVTILGYTPYCRLVRVLNIIAGDNLSITLSRTPNCYRFCCNQLDVFVVVLVLLMAINIMDT